MLESSSRQDADRRASATAECAQDLKAAIERYPSLFPSAPFDSAFPAKLAGAVAAGEPELDAPRLRTHALTSLWIFAVDWVIDHEATTAAEVEDTVSRCLRAADGHVPAPDDALARFLDELRRDLSKHSAFARLGSVWRDELRRMLEAMNREWHWNALREGSSERGGTEAVASPTLDQYLDNADNFGSTWSNVAHWIALGDPGVLARLEEMLVVSRRVQQVLRLANDLATIDRDRGQWDDLNVLLIGVGRPAVDQKISELAGDCHRLLASLLADCPRGAAFLRRQLEFSTAYYGAGRDYWGAV
ncbi:terpene synthase family protein [Spirillospora sp. CA-294931]|uniref:terpene synthase family protein n=1 Tax=Spirillospora sp. CA-294931 TaxID=3240042 RepID=UPI003D924740